MSTVIQILSSARLYLGSPPHDAVSDSMLLNSLYGRIDYFRTELSLTNQSWTAGEILLSVNPNQPEYLIPSGLTGPMGRPIKVEYYNESNTALIGPEIEVVLFQDSDLVGGDDGWWAERTGFSNDRYWSGALVASAFAFYGTPMKCRVIPRPLDNATYKIWHDQMSVNVPSFAQEPALQRQFHDLLALKVAWLNVDHCRFEDMDANVLAIWRRDRRSTLEKEAAQYSTLFSRFSRALTHPNQGLRRPFVPGGSSRRRQGYREGRD